jgi:hypothetical protein
MESTNGARRNLDALRNTLLRLHKTLLDSESANYHRNVQRIDSRQRLLDLVMHDPWFAWLREMSGLVISIDEALDRDPPPTPSDAERFIAQTRALLSPEETGEGFGKRYFQALQRDPKVVIAHGAAMALLRTLE